MAVMENRGQLKNRWNALARIAMEHGIRSVMPPLDKRIAWDQRFWRVLVRSTPWRSREQGRILVECLEAEMKAKGVLYAYMRFQPRA
jgi:hypothetical protein